MNAHLDLLTKPLAPRQSAILGLVLVAAAASYCVLHELLFYGFPSLSSALAWAAISVLPWLAAFECNKYVVAKVAGSRVRAGAILLVLLLALFASGITESLLFPDEARFMQMAGWHVVADLPETAIVALLTLIASVLSAPSTNAPAQHDLAELAPDPARILWLKSAGNYVEIAAHGRTQIKRMTLRQAQAMLDPAKFVRISRSVIINREALAQYEPRRALIRLSDGSEYKIGNAYRSKAAALV